MRDTNNYSSNIYKIHFPKKIYFFHISNFIIFFKETYLIPKKIIIYHNIFLKKPKEIIFRK